MWDCVDKADLWLYLCGIILITLIEEERKEEATLSRQGISNYLRMENVS